MYREPPTNEIKIILSTAGNPFHIGHEFLLFKSMELYGCENTKLYIDISCNIDKDIDEMEAKKRLSKINLYNVGKIFSTKSTFVKKSEWMNTLFPIGSDTALRIMDEKYYSSIYHRDYCLNLINNRGCAFLVFNRDEKFDCSYHEVFIDSKLESPKISSTEIRNGK